MEEIDLNGVGLTHDGARTLRELSERLGPDELAPLNAGIHELQTYVGLLHAAAAGDLAAVKAFGDIVLACPLPDEPMLTGGKPLPGPPESPCHLGAPHPLTFTFAGLNAADTYASGWRFGRYLNLPLDRDPSFPSDSPAADDYQPVLTWIDRAFAGWVVRAGGIEVALDAGRRWLDGGDPSDFRTALGALRSPCGVLPTNNIKIPCLDERQVCIAEFVFTAMRLAPQLGRPSFPLIGSVTPADQCHATAGPITLLPPMGQQFPSQDITKGGTFPAIDRVPATILYWTPQQIRLALPAGIKAGCHVVGWVYLYPPGVVSQLHAIGEQCRPWFGGGGLTRAPYALWEDQGRFSLISAPLIGTFHGPNGSTRVSAEACTPVTLSWAVVLDACPGTATQLAVTMWRDGQLFRVSLPTASQLAVSDSSPRTYTLRAQARLAGQLCGQTEQSLTVNRFNVLRVQAQGDTRCVQPGIGVTLNVTVSCPAPPGGLPVTVTSSHPARGAGASGTIDEGTTSTAIEVLTGTECGTATLTVTAPNHPQAQVSITVASYPTISAVSPTALQTCEPVSLTVDGSCLGEQAADIRAGVELNGQWVPGTVTVLSPGTQLRLDLPALPAGFYTLAITHCGQVGYAPLPFTVTTRQPVIDSLITTPASVEACSTPSVRIQWTVRYATQVLLTRDTAIIANRSYADPCVSVTDSATETLSTVMGSISYTLTAINADGVTTPSTRTLPITSSFPLASAFVVRNGYTDLVNVFLVNAEDQGGAFVQTLVPNATLLVPIPSCRLRAIISIDPKKVDDYNARWNTNYSATAVNTARTAGPWTRTTTQYALGLASAGVLGIIGV